MANIKSQYLAFVLGDASKALLLAEFKPRFSRVLCHHVTMQFNVTEESYQDHLERFKDADLKVVGYACDDSLEALVVSINGSTVREDGSTYHITLSLEPPRKPVDSNKMLRETIPTPVSVSISADLRLEPK